MITEEIIKFKTPEEMQVVIDKHLEGLTKKSEEYSKIIGDRLRENNDSIQESEVVELKEKLNGPTDPKKKKIVKKDKKSNWHEFDGLSVFDGMGLKGELELYFKALEETKSKIANLQKTKDSITNLISKGLKRDIGCVALMRANSKSEVVFVKTNVSNENRFSFKSIFSVYQEPIEITKSNISNDNII